MYAERYDYFLEFEQTIQADHYKPNRMSVGLLQGCHWVETALKETEWSFTTDIGCLTSCRFNDFNFLFALDPQDLINYCSENKMSFKWI